MPKPDVALRRVRDICLSLPDTRETPTWGEPHFRVGDKIFAGCGDHKGRQVLGFKLERAHAAACVKDPRFWPAAYVGHAGWVSMDAALISDWDEVAGLILESYRLIAPKRSLAKLDATLAVAAAPKAKRARATKATKRAKNTKLSTARRKRKRA